MRGSPPKPRELKPRIDKPAHKLAIKYGYGKKRAIDIGRTMERKEDSLAPVAKETNKTRRKMVNPTKKATYDY